MTMPPASLQAFNVGQRSEIHFYCPQKGIKVAGTLLFVQELWFKHTRIFWFYQRSFFKGTLFDHSIPFKTFIWLSGYCTWKYTLLNIILRLPRSLILFSRLNLHDEITDPLSLGPWCVQCLSFSWDSHTSGQGWVQESHYNGGLEAVRHVQSASRQLRSQL